MQLPIKVQFPSAAKRRNPGVGLLLSLLSLSTAFSLTTACGTPEEESNPLANKTFVLEIVSNNWTQPPMAAQISSYIPKFVIAFGAGTADQLPVTLATAKGGAQDPCGPTVAFTSGGNFALGPIEYPLHLVHPDATKMLTANTVVHSFTLSDVIPDGATLAEGSLTANVDIRDVYKLFTQANFNQSPDNPDVVCDIFEDNAAQAGTSCMPCADSQAYCITLKAEYLSAVETPLTVSSIAADVLTTPACAATP